MSTSQEQVANRGLPVATVGKPTASEKSAVTGDDSYRGNEVARLPMPTKSRRRFRSPVSDDDKSSGEETDLWTVYSARVCLPALLNDPTSGWRREADIFTQTWGENFIPTAEVPPSTRLPYVGRHDIVRQLKRITKGRTRLSPGDGRDSPVLSMERHALSVSADLDAIPKIFFRPEFVLEDPETFGKVMPWDQLAFSLPKDDSNQTSAMSKRPGQKPPRSSSMHSISVVPSHSTARLLQEKLSHYLDMVEVHLARQISQRSDDVFTAMSSYGSLSDDITHVCAHIQHVRRELHHLDDVLSIGSLKLLQLFKERSKYVEVYRKLRLMATVQQTQPTVQLLLASSDYVAAINLIATTQDVVHQELAGLQSFRHLGSQLAELEHMISRMMESEFLQLAGARLETAGMALTDECRDEEDRLSSVVYGLVRQHQLLFLVHYRDLAFSALKNRIRQTVMRVVTDELHGQGSASLADQMRALRYPTWREMMGRVFEEVLLVLKATKENHEIITSVLRHSLCEKDQEEVTSVPEKAKRSNSELSSDEAFKKSDSDLDNGTVDFGVGLDDDLLETHGLAPDLLGGDSILKQLDGPSLEDEESSSETKKGEATASNGFISRIEYERVSSDSYGLVCDACDLAQVRCAKLLGVRTKDVSFTKLHFADVVELSRQVEKFISDCEALCGWQIHNLRASLHAQCKKVLERFHEEHKTNLCLLLDGERWQQADIPAELQALISTFEHGLQDSNTMNSTPASASPRTHLVIHGEQYVVVGSPLLLLKMVTSYCQCLDSIPMLVTDIQSRLLDLFQTFNTRTCDLVLHAQARNAAGLKTISAKHLALSSRGLDVIIAVLPLVRAHFQKRLSTRQQVLLSQFDTVLKNYREHRGLILNKLVSMMEDVISKSLVKWEAKAPTPSKVFQTINSNFCKLHESLAPILSADQLELIFSNVQLAFRTHFTQTLKRLGLSPGCPQHGIVSAELSFLVEHLNSLEGLSDLGEALLDLWTR